MATDIHMFVEYDPGNVNNWLSIRPTGVWNLLRRWKIRRNYQLFSTLSGVGGEPVGRPSVITILKRERDTWWPRDPDSGLVTTGSESARALAGMSCDAHNEGWVSYGEVIDYLKAHPDARDDLGQILDLFEHLETERKLGHLLGGIRLVFFYDN